MTPGGSVLHSRQMPTIETLPLPHDGVIVSLTSEARKATWRAYYRRYPERSKARRIASQKSNADYVDSFKISCIRCGNNDKRVLDFHHRGGKLKGVATLRVAGYSKKMLLAEIEKCDCVCANCHRVIHWESRQ